VGIEKLSPWVTDVDGAFAGLAVEDVNGRLELLDVRIAD
jgi:hypothetical protein